MNWALVDRSGKCLGSPMDGYPAAMRSVMAHLPAESQEELLRLLDEACRERSRRRLSIVQPERPLVVVDILPLAVTESGDPPALVVLHDAAEFDTSLDRFRNLARRNEAILRSTIDGFFVVDADCRFLEANEAFCAMTGYSAGELLRMRISDLEVDEHPSGGVPSHTRTGLHHFPTAHRHKDGHIVHLDISINVLHDDGVKILVGLARDVTERVRAKEELVRLTRQQQLILDAAAEGIVGVDTAGWITLVNPAGARLLGTTTGQLIGRSAHDVFFPTMVHEADAGRDGCPICAVLSGGGRALRSEASFLREDGSQFPVDYSLSSLTESPDHLAAVLVFRDMSERRRAEQERRALESQIQQAQKLESLGLLAGGIAHDLNNILAGVQGHACLALTEVPSESGVGDRLRRIVRACERASRVIRQILTYSGHVTCEPNALDLNRLIRDTAEFMRAAIPDRITLDTQLEANLPLVAVDAGQFQQTMTSLLVNAADAIGENSGRITLCTSLIELTDGDILRKYSGQGLTAGKYVTIHVDDTGCGMTPETVKRIFEPFYSAKGTGRGLGLSAMHGVVRAHHGGVRVESEPGKGTRFTIALPIQQAPSGVAGAAGERPGQQGQPLVLVIDDEEEVREVIRDMLSTRDLAVLTAPDGQAGIDCFRDHAADIDLVILDMTMPGLGGADVFREMVNIRPGIPVIVASGYSHEQTPIRCGEAEPVAFLGKPFAMQALLSAIDAALHRDAACARRGAARPVAAH
ncbi:MAG: PAS domain S-box protein [Phycisphaerae bacterium]|jgi:PAS domain S-box-containing protein